MFREKIYSQGIGAKGFTLVELLISIAILSILVTVVAPNVQQIVIRNRIVGQVNELSGLIQLARSAAVNQRISVVLCPTQDQLNCTTNWNHNKMAFVDVDGNQQRAQTEEIIAGTQAIHGADQLTGPERAIIFHATGVTASPSSLIICPKNGYAEYARGLFISLQGRVKLSKDSDDDGIYENSSGQALSCS